MDRSTWRSQGPDHLDEYHQLARGLAHRYAVMEGVVGVVLAGGLTFGEADRHSDVDLVVYLYHQSLRTWFFGEAPLPEGESIYHGLRLDVSYRDFDHETQRSWSPGEYWAFSHAEVLYDPEGLVRDLLATKLKSTVEPTKQELIDLATNVRYQLERIVPAWLYRGEVLAAHHVLNQAADDLIQLVFRINSQTVPRVDWQIPLLETLEWVPENFGQRLPTVLMSSTIDASDASLRRHAMNKLIAECWNQIAPGESLEERSIHVSQTQMLRFLAEVGSIPLDTFREQFDVRLLIQSPAFDIVTIDRSRSVPTVRFNRDRLERIVHHELSRFLDYQQRLLRELADRPSGEIDG